MTVSDFLKRLKSLLPRWFADASPILDAILEGYAVMAAFLYSLIQYARKQVRISTASDGWLDLIAADFFGTRIRRRGSQSDATFRRIILANLLRERATRKGLIDTVTELTGTPPKVFEPRRALDTGVYGGPMIGYGVAGGYGSIQLPYQCFIDITRPVGNGIPLVAGYGVSTGGYHTPSRAAYASMSWITDVVSDADILAAIADTKPEATIVWARFVENLAPVTPSASNALDSFILDQSTVA